MPARKTMPTPEVHKYPAEDILSKLCIRISGGHCPLLAYKPPLAPGEMDPVAVWFRFNGEKNPTPGVHELPPPPHKAQPGELWALGKQPPRRGIMGIVIGFIALDYESPTAMAAKDHKALEQATDFQPAIKLAKKLLKRNISIHDNIAIRGEGCLPALDLPHDRMYRVVAKVNMNLSGSQDPHMTNYYVLADPDAQGICDGFRVKGISKWTVFALPGFRNDNNTNEQMRLNQMKSSLNELRRRFLGLPPKDSDAVSDFKSLLDSANAMASIEDDDPVTPQRRNSEDVPVKQPTSPGKETTGSKRKRQGEDVELFFILSGRFGGSPSAAQIRDAWTGFVKEHPDFYTVVDNFKLADVHTMVTAFAESECINDYALVRPAIFSYAKRRQEIREGDPIDAAALVAESTEYVKQILGPTSKLSLNEPNASSQAVRDLHRQVQPLLSSIERRTASHNNYIATCLQNLASAKENNKALEKDQKKLRAIFKMMSGEE